MSTALSQISKQVMPVTLVRAVQPLERKRGLS